MKEVEESVATVLQEPKKLWRWTVYDVAPSTGLQVNETVPVPVGELSVWVRTVGAAHCVVAVATADGVLVGELAVLVGVLVLIGVLVAVLVLVGVLVDVAVSKLPPLPSRSVPSELREKSVTQYQSYVAPELKYREMPICL